MAKSRDEGDLLAGPIRRALEERRDRREGADELRELLRRLHPAVGRPSLAHGQRFTVTATLDPTGGDRCDLHVSIWPYADRWASVRDVELRLTGTSEAGDEIPPMTGWTDEGGCASICGLERGAYTLDLGDSHAPVAGGEPAREAEARTQEIEELASLLARLRFSGGQAGSHVGATWTVAATPHEGEKGGPFHVRLDIGARREGLTQPASVRVRVGRERMEWLPSQPASSRGQHWFRDLPAGEYGACLRGRVRHARSAPVGESAAACVLPGQDEEPGRLAAAAYSAPPEREATKPEPLEEPELHVVVLDRGVRALVEAVDPGGVVVTLSPSLDLAGVWCERVSLRVPFASACELGLILERVE